MRISPSISEMRVDMSGFLLIIPMLLIRYGLPLFVDKGSMKRLAFTPPTKGRERIAFWIYIPSTFAIIIYLFFITITVETTWFYIGLSIYGTGILLYAVSMINFGKPSEQGINTNGLYRFSRNPIYVAFFLFLLGSSMMTQSLILFVLVIIYQVSVHWIILSEERWCLTEFGDQYKRYMERVRRYL